MPLFEAKVGGTFVAEELFAVADEKLVDADHRGFSGNGIADDFRAGDGGGEAVGLKKGLEPFEAPFQGANDAVFIARGQPRFPVIHPARVAFLQHVSN